MAACRGFHQMMHHIQERGDALYLVKHYSFVLSLGGFDLAQECCWSARYF